MRALDSRAMIAAMRRLAIAVALGVVACGDSANAPSDAGNVVRASPDGGDGDADSDAPETQNDAPDPFQCASTASIVLSNPTITAGAAAPGQTATLTITMSDTSPNGYVSYPGIVLTTSTPGITFISNAGPPGALIDHTSSKPVRFTLSFDASIPSGSTSASFNARAYGCGVTPRPTVPTRSCSPSRSRCAEPLGCRREQEELRELERRSERDEKNFATMMAGITASLGESEK